MRIISSLVNRVPTEIWSAILVSLAFPPVNLFLLVFVGLAPMLRTLTEVTPKQAFWIGWRYGYVFLFIQLIWLGQFVTNWTQMPLLGIVIVMIAPLVFAWLYGLFAMAAQRAWAVNRPWTIPLAWMLVEFVMGRFGPLAFPWSPLGLPLANMSSLIQLASYGQIGILSAWAALGSVVLVVMALHENPQIAARYLVVFLGLLVFSFALELRPIEGQKKLLAAAQPGVNVAFGDQTVAQVKLAEACRDLYLQAKFRRVDLVVFPERIAEGGRSLPPLMPFEATPNIPVVFGGNRIGADGRAYQTAYSNAPQWSSTDKTQLVIFGEYVPFRSLLPASLKLPQGDLTPGTKVEIIQAGKLKVGPQLCFEALFPHVGYEQATQGAQVATVMAIDDWYLGSAAPEQLQLASRIRAVESGLPLIRAATMGRSMIFDARGRELAVANYGAKQIIAAVTTVPQSSSNPPARAWVPGIALFMMLAGLFVRPPGTRNAS